jgi:hypothetical protein
MNEERFLQYNSLVKTPIHEGDGMPRLPIPPQEPEITAWRERQQEPVIRLTFKDPRFSKWIELHNTVSLQMYGKTYLELGEEAKNESTYWQYIPPHESVKMASYKAATVRGALRMMGLQAWFKRDFWDNLDEVERKMKDDASGDHGEAARALSA